MSKIKAFVFDADGVLIKLTSHFSEFFSQKYNIPYSKIGPFFENEFKQCIVGKGDLKQLISPKLKDWNRAGTVGDLLEFWFHYASNVDSSLIEIIQSLRSKGYRCYLATNQEKYRIEDMKSTLGIGNIFDAIFVSCELGYKKPHLEFYQTMYEKIIEDIDIKKDEILFIDDKENNIEKAKEFGLKTHLYTNFHEFKKLVDIFW